VSKPNRRLWEVNNRHREFWGEHPLPVPEGGFADEPLPPLYHEVERVFRAATSGQPHRPRQERVPSPAHIGRIARLLNEWRALPEPGPAELEAARKGTRLARAVAELEKALGEVLALALPEAMLGDPAVTRLVDLHNAVVLAAHYVPPPRKQGAQALPWHELARQLESRVQDSLADAEHRRASRKADGPLVKIIVGLIRLLAKRFPKPPTEHAVEHVLKRRPRIKSD
jgi:hypothetical protein